MWVKGTGALYTKVNEQSVNPYLCGSIGVGLENQINSKNIDKNVIIL